MKRIMPIGSASLAAAGLLLSAGSFAHAGSGQLFEQQRGGLVELVGEFGDGGTCHGCGSPLGPPWFSWRWLRRC